VKSQPIEVKAEFEAVLRRAALVHVGEWHSHPTVDATPSEDDRNSWAAVWATGFLPYAAVIVTPGELGWTTPKFHGYVTLEDDDGRLVAQPAIVSGW
jgi:proteasome lid subunit RPN8/RPN11